MDKNKKHELGASLICLLLVVALLYMAQYMPVVVITIPFVLVFAVVYCGYTLGGVVMLLGFGAGFFFGTLMPGLMAAAFVPVAVAAGYMIREKKRFRNSVALTAAAALAGSALAILVLLLLTGQPVVDFTAHSAGAWLQSASDDEVKAYYTVIRSVDLMTGAITQSAIDATPPAKAIVTIQKIIKDYLNIALVYYMLLYALVLGYLGVIIPRAVAKSRGKDMPRIPAFADYTLPKRFWLAAMASTLVAMIGAESGWPGFDILLFTIYNVYAFVLMMQGLCVLDFFFRMRSMGKGVRVVLHILAALLLGTMLLPIAGLIENAIGIRKRIQPRKAV